MKPIEVIDLLEEELRRKVKELKLVIMEQQTNCDHPLEALVEGDFKAAGYITYAQPPFYVCRNCGYAEEQWGAGLWKLGKFGYDARVPSLPRNVAMKYIRGTMKSQRDLGSVRFDGAPIESLWGIKNGSK